MKKPVEVEPKKERPAPTLVQRIAGQIILWSGVLMVIAMAASVGALAVRHGFGLA